jgi:hypothetical protein
MIICRLPVYKESPPKKIIPGLDSADPDSYPSPVACLPPAKEREEKTKLSRNFFENKELKHVTDNGS